MDRGPLQQKVQGIPLNKLLNHQILPVSLRRLVDYRQVAAGAVQQLPVDLPIAGETAENELPTALPVPDELHAAPGTLLQKADHLKLGPQLFVQPRVNDDHPKFQTLCGRHIVSGGGAGYNNYIIPIFWPKVKGVDRYAGEIHPGPGETTEPETPGSSGFVIENSALKSATDRRACGHPRRRQGGGGRGLPVSVSSCLMVAISP